MPGYPGDLRGPARWDDSIETLPTLEYWTSSTGWENIYFKTLLLRKRS